MLDLKCHGIQITVRSTVEPVKFLLQNDCLFILTERLCLDPVQEYFGIRRQLGRRNNNPDIVKSGYNDNTIRIQKDASFTSENTTKEIPGFKYPVKLF